MSTFTLAISRLTTSNLPWFVDLIFQVPMQYYSLQHRTLLPSPVTSTTGCCFCFGSISSLFLVLVYTCIYLYININTASNWVHDSDAGIDWRQKEKGMTEDEMVGWPHQLYGHELEQAPGTAEGQRSLVCCSPWGWTQLSDWSELNWTDNWYILNTHKLYFYYALLII